MSFIEKIAELSYEDIPFFRFFERKMSEIETKLDPYHTLLIRADDENDEKKFRELMTEITEMGTDELYSISTIYNELSIHGKYILIDSNPDVLVKSIEANEFRIIGNILTDIEKTLVSKIDVPAAFVHILLEYLENMSGRYIKHIYNVRDRDDISEELKSIIDELIQYVIL